MSISNTLQSTSLDHATTNTGYITQVAHEKKLQKLQDPCIEYNIKFFPMVWESTERETYTVHFMLESWMNQEANCYGLPRSRIQVGLYHRLSLTLQREYEHMHGIF